MFVRKCRSNWKLSFLLAVTMMLLFILTGCKNTDTAVIADEPQKQTDQPTNTDSFNRRDYRTQIKGGGEDAVTLMIYLCGSDLESMAAAATLDLYEIVTAQISDNINIVVETGGAREWAVDMIDPDKNQRWQVVDNDLVLLESLEAKNMSKGSTLEDFVVYAAQNFPADRYMLVLWDHGGGTVAGYAYDERFDNDAMMSIAELDKALDSAGVVFDMIGFDCCLMSTVETAFMVEKYADYMVASQRVEPGNGWYYTTWIEALSQNPSIPTAELGKIIADSFIEQSRDGFYGNELTLSVTDLTYIPELFSALYDFLPEAQINLLEGDMFISTSQALSGSRAMQGSHDLIDLSYLVETMGGSRELVNLLEQCVVYNDTTIENHNGLCMYIPYTDLNNAEQALSVCDSIGIDRPYQDFIIAFANMMLGGQLYSGGGTSNPFGGDEFDASSWLDLSWADEDAWFAMDGFFADNSYDASELFVDEKGDDFVLSMSDEDWELITAVNLRVFVDDGEGFIDLGADGVYEFDDDGDLLIQFDYYWVALDGQIVCFYQEEEDYDDDGSWYSYGVVPIYYDEEYAELVVVWDNDFPDGYVAGWRYTAFGGETQKGLYELKDGMQFDFLCDFYTYDGEYDDQYFFGDMTVNGPVTVSYEDIGDYDCWIYYELYDIFNNTYWTESIVYSDDDYEYEYIESGVLDGFMP